MAHGRGRKTDDVDGEYYRSVLSNIFFSSDSENVFFFFMKRCEHQQMPRGAAYVTHKSICRPVSVLIRVLALPILVWTLSGIGCGFRGNYGNV